LNQLPAGSTKKAGFAAGLFRLRDPTAFRPASYPLDYFDSLSFGNINAEHFFHSHRNFCATTGEPVSITIRRSLTTFYKEFTMTRLGTHLAQAATATILALSASVALAALPVGPRRPIFSWMPRLPASR
jgi:hypothetical protein